jgi:Rrf2 family protein
MAKIVTLSEAASIALHSMILIARSKASVNVDQISERIGSSRHHIAKIMQRLAKDGFVGSNRGPSGGFYLLKETHEINLLAIYESVEGKVVPSVCPMEKQICSFDKCFLNNLTYDLTKQFMNYMQQHTLADYL